MLGGMAGAAGVAIGAIVGIGVAVGTASVAIYGMADASLQAAKALRQISPSQAAIAAEADVRELMRNLKFGEETADSTRKLNDAFQDAADTWNDIKIIWTNIKNNILATLLGWIKAILDFVKSIAGWLGNLFGVTSEINDELKKQNIKPVGELGLWLKQVANETEDRRRVKGNRNWAIPRLNPQGHQFAPGDF
jgi:hypothetical protein